MRIAYLSGFVALLAMGSAHAADYIVSQKNKTFSHSHLKVKVGDVVNFVNDDPFFHNVFSLSDSKAFDLGSYPQGQGRKVVFDQPGQVYVECAIHPFMKMKVDVSK